MDEYLEIQELAKQGLTNSEIARRLSLNRHTVGKYLKETSGPPVSTRRHQRTRLLDRFEGYLHKRMAQGCSNAIVLLREIKTQGYAGSYTTLKDYLRPLR